MYVVLDYVEWFGVYDEMNDFLFNVFGVQEIMFYCVVVVYVMFVNGGECVLLIMVDCVQDCFGQIVYCYDDWICVDCGIVNLFEGELFQIVLNCDWIMNVVIVYQLILMMQGVVDCGIVSCMVNLFVLIVGKIGMINDVKDVWFVGFSLNIVVGCYIGYDILCSFGFGVLGGGLCGFVFNEFMIVVIVEFGGGFFVVLDECQFIKIDCFIGVCLLDDVSGENVNIECFCCGEEFVFGIMFDGGFVFSDDLLLFDIVLQEICCVIMLDGGIVVVGLNVSLISIILGGLY